MARPYKVSNAIILFNISEVYHAMSERSLEQRYYQESLDLLRETLIEEERIPPERAGDMMQRILKNRAP